jgi:hypothetical protein
MAVSPVTATVLSLMSLVLAFSFANAASRLDSARSTILAEVNSLETAWQRIDLAEPEGQPRLRALLRDYVDARIRAYEAIYDDDAEYRRQVVIGRRVLRQVWAVAVEHTTLTPNRTLLLGAMGAVGDAAGARTLSLGMHLPAVVFVFLFGIVLIGSMLIGYALAAASDRRWLHRLTIATVLAAVVFAILDMEYPRLAIELLSSADAMLVDLRKTMR